MNETWTTPTTTAGDRAGARAAADEMMMPASSTTALRGEAAAEHGQTLLEEVLGGPDAVPAAVRGRTTLGRTRLAGYLDEHVSASSADQRW